MRKLLIAILFLLVSTVLSAIPALPVREMLPTSDGNVVAVTLAGDEHGHYYIDDLGNGYQLGSDGVLQRDASQSTRRVAARREAARRAALLTTFPTLGTVRSVVILVNFTDKKFSSATPQDDFSRMLNDIGYSENGAVGSAKDYYHACSNGQFRPQFDVYGPYELDHDMAYYGTNVNGVDGNPAQMIVDACAKANNDVNFSHYDLDNDDFIDNVFVYYAGYSEAEGAPSAAIWPHRWTVMPVEIYGSKNGNTQSSKQQCTFDGKLVLGYACTSELKGKTGNNMCGVGVFCHEFGHVLGLVDLYHTTSSKKPTLGNWDIMDGGSYSDSQRTPPLFSAFERYVVGWETPRQIMHPETVHLTPPSQDEENRPDEQQSCIIADGVYNFNPAYPSPSEYFVLEYRKKQGWDKFLPDEGLLIWHIDFNRDKWHLNTINNYEDRQQTYHSHMGVYLQHPANDNTTPGQPFKNGDRFVPTMWNSHALLADSVTNIRISGSDLTFDFMGGLELDLTPPTLDSITHITQNSMRLNWTDHRDDVSQDTTNYQYEIIAYYDYNGDTVANYIKSKDLTHELLNLKAGYYVSAKVRTLITLPYYERVTPWSNLMAETTLMYENAKQLPHFIENGVLYVVKNDAQKPLLLFDATGRKIAEYNTCVNAEPVDLSRLSHQTVYIFRQGSRYLKWVW